MRLSLLILCSLLVSSLLLGQTLADKLGYPEGSRLLIIHADDLGMAHSVNAASFKALTEGHVTSASIMMPTPWVSEVAAFAKTHPELDLGLHLTLTSEWENYRWGPMGRDSVSSLLDEDHYLHGLCHEMAATASAVEVELELRRQVDQALLMGINPTHLDSHMGCLVYTEDAFFQAYLNVARDYDLPPLVDRKSLEGTSQHLAKYVQPTDLVVDRVFDVSSAKQSNFKLAYDDLLTNMGPGVSVLLLHCAYDNAEMQSAAAPQEAYGSAWRQKDFEYFSSQHFADLLKAQNIIPVTWRELYAKWKAVQ
ncbi:MAG: polysaccharide deacetylase family protein [Saprospiraceae bacterium]